MVILDEPFASSLLLEWLESSKHPVLSNAYTRTLQAEGIRLHLVDDNDAKKRIDGGERVYTNSENALFWILEHTNQKDLCRGIRLFKDKAKMREVLAPLNPDLYYRTFDEGELKDLSPEELSLPVVLKPNVGFCSMGVYVIQTPKDFEQALKDIEESREGWQAMYPECVIEPGTYIVESYLQGQEYAIDMYYDAEGAPVILNILRHDFASMEDTSDRMYLTSSAIINEMYEPFMAWLCKVNGIVGVKNFPIHIEIRVNGHGDIAPIEFNPLRFAGLGGTDVALYAWGIRTYAAYLEDVHPNLLELARIKPELTYCMSLLNPAPTADLARPFDYDALEQKFSHVLDFHRFDVNKVGSYGFLFLECADDEMNELDYLLHTDLLEFT